MTNPDTDSWPWAEHTELAKEAECFETPEWAVEAILEKEGMIGLVVDPCCGRGVMVKAAEAQNYETLAFDKYEWGYVYQTRGVDFLEMQRISDRPFTIFMNPPFSLAEDFVRHSFALGARKIVAFQRFAWRESKKRRPFWAEYPPNRIYVCSDRADCWRIDIPPEGRGSGTPTAHAWFVWEVGHPVGTLVGEIHKR